MIDCHKILHTAQNVEYIFLCSNMSELEQVVYVSNIGADLWNSLMMGIIFSNLLEVP